MTRPLGDFHELSSHQCPGDESFGYGPYTWGIRDYRGARLLQETPPFVPSQKGAPPWIYPMAVAYDYTVTTRPGEDPCDLVDERTTSRDPIIASSIAPGALDDYFSAVGPSAEVPRCGISEREFTLSTNCQDAMGALGANMPPNFPIGHFDSETGAALVEDLAPLGRLKCWLREPRRYRPTCPSGLSCTAGGECVASARPPTAIVSLTPPAPAP